MTSSLSSLWEFAGKTISEIASGINGLEPPYPYLDDQHYYNLITNDAIGVEYMKETRERWKEIRNNTLRVGDLVSSQDGDFEYSCRKVERMASDFKTFTHELASIELLQTDVARITNNVRIIIDKLSRLDQTLNALKEQQHVGIIERMELQRIHHLKRYQHSCLRDESDMGFALESARQKKIENQHRLKERKLQEEMERRHKAHDLAFQQAMQQYISSHNHNNNNNNKRTEGVERNDTNDNNNGIDSKTAEEDDSSSSSSPSNFLFATSRSPEEVSQLDKFYLDQSIDQEFDTVSERVEDDIQVEWVDASAYSFDTTTIANLDDEDEDRNSDKLHQNLDRLNQINYITMTKSSKNKSSSSSSSSRRSDNLQLAHGGSDSGIHDDDDDDGDNEHEEAQAKKQKKKKLKQKKKKHERSETHNNNNDDDYAWRYDVYVQDEDVRSEDSYELELP